MNREGEERRKKQMADDLTKRGKPDQIRVNVHEDWELRYHG
jgi:hypothetical protein